MKKISLTMYLLAMCFVISQAQEHKLNMSSGKLIIKEVDRVTVEGYTGSEVIFSTDYVRKRNDERGKGLRPINGGGIEDNTDIGLSVVKTGNDAEVRQVSPNSKARYTIKVPKGVSIYYEHTTYHGKQVQFENVESEIEVSVHYNSVDLKNVTGPMAIKSVYGHIEAEFGSLNQTGSVSLYSTYDFVDVTLPTAAKANVTMSTPYGEMLTDMKIDMGTSEGEMTKLSSKKVTGTINGGGVDLSLKSSYKNIYLRKK